MPTPAEPTYSPPPGTTLNDQGYWITPGGDLAPGQMTPGRRANPEGEIYYDPQRDLFYNVIGGQKRYQSPASYQGRPGAIPGQAPKGTGFGQLQNDPGGGAFHGTPTWNPQTGKFDVGLDMGKILSYLAAGGIGAGVADAAGLFGGAGAGAGITTGPTLPGAAASTWGPAAAAAGTGAASSWPSRLSPALKAGLPLALSLPGGPLNPGSGGGGSVDPGITDSLKNLIDLSTRRFQSTEPVHAAAMALAQRLAPSAVDNPRVAAAIDATRAGGNTGQMSPEVLAAIQRLTGHP